MNDDMQVGIDQLHMYSPHYYLDLKELARARDLPEIQFNKSIGQINMAITPPDEDIITMAANAAKPIVAQCAKIDMLIFATESSVDQSKSAATFVHNLLGLPNACRVFELKQACYAATAALHMACNHIYSNHCDNVLIVASDIAKYAANSVAETSQGAGAIAMLIRANPRLITINPQTGFHTEDRMDFWRPPYQKHALVDGKHSCDLYLKLLRLTWDSYTKRSDLCYQDHDHFCFHTPVPKLAQRAFKWLGRQNNSKMNNHEIEEKTNASLAYHRQIGNTYTASLYICLLSLIDNLDTDLANNRVGLYSYGSGCMAEFFSGVIQPSYHSVLSRDANIAHLQQRQAIDFNTYQEWAMFQHCEDGSCQYMPKQQTSGYRLNSISAHKRCYEVVADA